nr:hypothetical protein [Candidatus Saccharibacteria bacterium]
MEHWVKTTKSRITRIISKIKRQNLQKSQFGRLIKALVKRVVLLVALVTRNIVKQVRMLNNKYWNPARQK